MLGLRIGQNIFIVDAPGFIPAQGTALLRTTPSAPIVFTLARDQGPPPGVLPANIHSQITAANALRDEGRLDQALSAYQTIRSRNANLTAINLVMAATYRRKAALQTDVVARRAALERAIECYDEFLKADPENDRAKAELAATRAEAATIPN